MLGVRLSTVMFGAAWLLGVVQGGCGSPAASPSQSPSNGPGGIPIPSGPCMAGFGAGTVLGGMSAACQSCVQGACSMQMAACTSDCTCNSGQGSAIACLGVLTPASTADDVTGCVSGLGGASNAPLMALGTCLSSCVASCNGGAMTVGGGSPDAGSPVDAHVDAPLRAPDARPDVAAKPDAKLDMAAGAKPDVGSSNGSDAPAGGDVGHSPPHDADDSDGAGTDLSAIE
jgi:hypothetical protein